MKKGLLIIIAFLLVSCAPSEAAIQKAIQQTQTAAPTLTPTPSEKVNYANNIKSSISLLIDWQNGPLADFMNLNQTNLDNNGKIVPINSNGSFPFYMWLDLIF